MGLKIKHVMTNYILTGIYGKKPSVVRKDAGV